MNDFFFTEHIIATVGDTDGAARDFLAAVTRTRHAEGAVVVGLSGDLGAGKTTFSQAVARALSITETVTSPTFVIEKIYVIQPAKNGFSRLVHIDAYRLESPTELTKLGFAFILADSGNLVLIEWPERLGTLLPSPAITLFFCHINETTRSIKVL